MKRYMLLTIGLAASLIFSAEASQQQLAQSIKEARTEANRTDEQLRSTLAAVNALTKQKSGDLRPAYEAFAREVPKTQSAADWTRARVQFMAGDGRKYFDDWQKTINSVADSSLRKKGQKRLDSARKSYAAVEAELVTAADKFRPFLSHLNDIQKVLSKDVTANGVKSVKSVVRDANWDYKGVSAAINNALKEMQKMEDALSSQAG
jgi:hypothetical protein